MKTYLIGYDLDRPGQDYKNLFEAIKTYPAWYHMIDSTWLVKSDLTAVQVRDHLSKHIDQNDKLFVACLTGEAAWHGLPAEGANWLKSELKAA